MTTDGPADESPAGKPHIDAQDHATVHAPQQVSRDYIAEQHIHLQPLSDGVGVGVEAAVSPEVVADPAVIQQTRRLPAGGDSSVETGGRAPAVRRVPARNPNFSGREEMLERLHSLLAADKPVVVQALYGMGGVGKTQLAVEYVHRYAADYELVWWFYADQPALIPEQFAAVAATLNLPSRQLSGPDVIEAVLQALQGLDRWLLVFDNVPEPQDLQPYRPPFASGRVLVTSRHPGWGGIARRIEVDLFPRAESVLLLRRRIPDVAEEVADELAHELGDLPLALEQAAGYIESNGSDPRRYLQLLRSARESLLSEGSVPDHVLLDATWQLSVDRLQQDDPAAVQLLRYAAFLAPEPLPVALFADPEHPGLPDLPHEAFVDPVRTDRMLGALHRYALARRDGDSIEMHRLVQAAVRRAMTPSERTAAQHALLRLMRAVVPKDILRHPGTWPRWRQLLPHVLAVCVEGSEQVEPEATSWLLDLAGTYLQSKGEPAAARPLLERALRIDEVMHGPDHPAVAPSLNHLALVLLDLGESTEAQPLLERALRIDEAAYGLQHQAVATSLNNLALVLNSRGQPAAALPLMKRAAEIQLKIYGPDDPASALSLVNLAGVLADLGEPAAAWPLLARALRINEAAHGPDHPAVATTLGNLATVLRDLGNPAAALSPAERALRIDEALYGPEHPTVALRMGILAMVLWDQGDPGGARPLLERALRIDEAAYGPGHPVVALRVGILARVLWHLGDPGAGALLERALRLNETVHGPDHPVVPEIRRLLEQST